VKISRSQTPVWECLLPSSAWCIHEQNKFIFTLLNVKQSLKVGIPKPELGNETFLRDLSTKQVYIALDNSTNEALYEQVDEVVDQFYG